MNARSLFSFVSFGLFVIATIDVFGQTTDDPFGPAGAIKPRVETAGSYDPNSGNVTRSVTDLHVPGALGYGLDYTRHYNSVSNIPVSTYGEVGTWSHSWQWKAELDSVINFCDNCSYNKWVTYTIKITYPDGRVQTFKFNHYDNEVPNPEIPIPYPAELGKGKTEGDFLGNIPTDGDNFDLFRADGSTVHFDGAWQATKMTDPHGLTTTLTYASNLLTVTGPDARSLRIIYGNVGSDCVNLTACSQVVSAVESGSGAGLQRVEYDYTEFLFNTAFLTTLPQYRHPLIAARYVSPVDATGASTAPAAYHYTPYLNNVTIGKYAFGPLLDDANDPRFDGPMTHIKYVYRGGPGGTPFYSDATCPGYQYLPRWSFAPFPMEKELSGDTNLLVSQLYIPPNCAPDTGTRTETRGSFGSRKFYYGETGGADPSDGAQTYNSGSVVTKLTDFAAAQPSPTPADFRRDYITAAGHPWRVFDQRKNLIEYKWSPSINPPVGSPPDKQDSCSQISEIWFRGFDNGGLDGNNSGSSHTTFRSYDWKATSFTGDNWGSPDAALNNPYKQWLHSKTDERNFTTKYTRDAHRRVTRIDYPDLSSETFAYNILGQTETHVTASGATETYVYDNGTHLLQSESNSVEPDNYKEYTYDAFGHIATMREGRARANGASYSVMMEYDARHQVTKVHYPSTGGAGDPYVLYEYDGYGNCTGITNELGHRSSYTYDAYRRCSSYTEPLDAPAWNGIGNVSSRTWNWYYDRAIPPNYTTVADQSTHTSKQWRVQIEPAFNSPAVGASIGDRRLSAHKFDYNDRIIEDQKGLIQRGSDGAWLGTSDTETVLYQYDFNGNKQKYTDARGRMTTYTYDKRDRVTQTKEETAVGVTPYVSRITSTAWDPTGNKTLVTFPDNKTQQWLSYNEFGHPRQFVDERGNITGLNYWPWGPMTKVQTVITTRDKDAGGTEEQHTDFFCDYLGRPGTVYFPDGSYEQTIFQYGQVSSWRTRKSAQKTINYDARGRETSHTWNDSLTPGVTRQWDDANRLASLVNSFSTITYGYDKAGQAISETSSVTGALGAATLTYFRYPDGGAGNLVYPNGFKLRRDYTARGQLAATGSSDPNGNFLTTFARYTYLSDAKLDLEDNNPPTGMHTKFTYDGRGFIIGTNTYKASASQPYTNRTYYRSTTITGRDRIDSWKKGTYATINPTENNRGDKYTYDAEGQLTAASYQATYPTFTGAQRTESFLYDQLGNRKGSTNQLARWPGSTITFHRRDNGLNQYLDWPQSAINYEANGNLYQDGWLTATYNALNQPISIWSWIDNPSGGAVTFGYDPLGRCVKRTNIGGVSTYLYYDGWNLIQEGPAALVADRIYAHGNRVDEVVASQYAGVWNYHHYDARGHCIMLTNAAGVIVEQYDYDAFGKPYFYNASNNWTANVGNSIVGNRFLFTGREWLKDIAVYDFRNRHYLPELGRFIQPDPKEFDAGDYNLYRYCHNDPVNKSDPTGLYVVYSGRWTDADAQNFREQFAKQWGTAEGRQAWTDRYNSALPSIVSPYRGSDAPPAANGGASNFSIANTVPQSASDRQAMTMPGQAPRTQPDKRLSDGEMKALEKGGIDPHEYKPKVEGSRYDFFKDAQGNVKVKLKDGSGPGDPTGLNMNDYRQFLP